MDLSHCYVFMQTVKTTLYLQNFPKQREIKKFMSMLLAIEMQI